MTNLRNQHSRYERSFKLIVQRSIEGFEHERNISRFYRLLAVAHKTLGENVISIEKFSLKKRHDLKIGVVEVDLNDSVIGEVIIGPCFKHPKWVAEVRGKVNESDQFSTPGIDFSLLTSAVEFLEIKKPFK